MWKQVRSHVLECLSGEDEDDVQGLLDRVVSLDATRGAVDGSCFLLLGADGTPRFVAKAAQTPAGAAIFRREHETLCRLEAGGLNARGAGAPRPLGIREEAGLLVTVQSALHGRLLKNEPGTALFAGRHLQATLEALEAWYERFLRCLEADSRALDDAVYERDVAGEVHRFLARFRAPDADRRLLCERFLEARPLLERPLPLVARHGDFCTANMVLQPHGLGVFDWEFDLTPRTPLFDIFFFLSSTRFPYGGFRGESRHFDSFVEVWWGDSALSLSAKRFVRRIGERCDVGAEALGDLFLLSLVQVANMKFEALVEAAGRLHQPIARGAEDDAGRAAHWASLPRADKDVPFACIREGRLHNLAAVVERGLPLF